jgi:hypothetical protein
LTWVINSTFLPKFYIYTKTKTLDKAYNEIVSIYKNSTSPGYLSEEDTKKMEQLALKYNVDVNVINQNVAVIYPAQDNYSSREYDNIMLRVMGYRFPGSNKSMQNIKILEALNPMTILKKGYYKIKKDGKTVYKDTVINKVDNLEIDGYNKKILAEVKDVLAEDKYEIR